MMNPDFINSLREESAIHLGFKSYQDYLTNVKGEIVQTMRFEEHLLMRYTQETNRGMITVDLEYFYDLQRLQELLAKKGKFPKTK